MNSVERGRESLMTDFEVNVVVTLENTLNKVCDSWTSFNSKYFCVYVQHILKVRYIVCGERERERETYLENGVGFGGESH